MTVAEHADGQGPQDGTVLAYRAVALQSACHAVDVEQRAARIRDAMVAAIDRVHTQVQATKANLGPALRLVVLPEYLLTGPPRGRSIEAWARLASLDPDGAPYRRLGDIARDADVFLCVNAYERDEHFPGVYFQASVVFDPRGDQVLRYRRLNSMYTVTPHDVLDRYLSIYGPDSLFPVASTEIGRLAAVASEEILFPEVARCLALRGAEVLLHSSSEIASAILSPKNAAKISRAVENVCCVVSANTAGLYGTGLPPASGDGGSRIINHRGIVLAQAQQGESMAANAEIDIAAIRRARREVSMENLLARQRLELYAPTYGTTSVYPPNTVSTGIERAHFARTQESVISRLVAHGVI
jgi:predicted amidohydrolase